MTYIRVSGFKIFKDRHGKQRCYHRKTGIKIDLERAPIGSAAFIVECEKINALMVSAAGQGPKPGTLGGLVSTYFGLDHFANLSPATPVIIASARPSWSRSLIHLWSRSTHRCCLAFTTVHPKR